MTYPKNRAKISAVSSTTLLIHHHQRLRSSVIPSPCSLLVSPFPLLQSTPRINHLSTLLVIVLSPSPQSHLRVIPRQDNTLVLKISRQGYCCASLGVLRSSVAEKKKNERMKENERKREGSREGGKIEGKRRSPLC